ncbi:MAG: Ig-like domain-containing protein, partial [Acutalibacteraceae bacterium]
MNIDESIDFKVSINPTNASMKNLQWTSSDTSIVSVTDKGYSGSTAVATLKALKAGTVTLKFAAKDGSGKYGSVKVTVQPRISSITIEKMKVVAPSVKTETVNVTILPKDAGNQVLSWSSSNPDICDVDYSGKLIPKSLGVCTIYVKTTDGSNLSGECKVRVASLATSMSISKSTYTLNTEQSVTLKATVKTNDGSTYTDLVEWTSENTKIATVDSNGKVTALYPGTVIIRARAIDGTERSVVCALTVKQPVKGVSITEKKSVGVGKTVTLKPTFSPTYATNQNVTWSSSNSAVATVSSSGVVTGKKVGTAVITCKTEDGGYTAKCTVTVIIATTGVTLDKTRASVYTGKTVTITGTVVPSNATDKTLTWSSSDTSVAKVSSTGVVTGVTGGTCTITCKNSGGQSAVCKITVLEKVSGITLNRSSATLYTSQKYTLTATVTPSTATDKSVTWSSSNSKVASVSSSGVVTGVAAGSAVIIAVTVDGGFIAKCSITVVKKVDVTGVKLNKTSVSLNKGGQYQLDATVSPSNASEKSVTWSSNNTSIAKVSSSGLVTAVANGSAVITAKTKDGSFTAKCTVNVTSQVTGVRVSPSEYRLAKGSSKTLIVNVFPTDATNQKVTWSSSNTKIVTVNSKGVVTAVRSGTATVTATTADGGFTSSCNFTVYIPVTGVRLNSTDVTVAKGKTAMLTAKVLPSTASDNTVRWSSSDSSVVSVNSAGQLTGKKVGTAIVTVSSTDGNYSDTCVVNVVQLAEKVTLDYTSLTLYAGKTKTLGAKLKPSTTSNQKITWTSSNKAVATVNSKGQITAVAGGTAVIKATSGDKQTSSTCKITVIEEVTKITLSAKSKLVRVGQSKTITATALPKTATDRSITWKSSNTKVAKVTSNGTIKGISKGTATITAYSADKKVKASCTVTVIKSVTGVSLNYSSVTLTANKKLTLKAAIKPSDAYYQQVTWKSSNYDVADVSSTGTVTAKKPGYAEITVKTKDGGYKAVCQVLVVQPVTSVSLNLKEEYVDIGSSITLKATVKPSNATDKSVVWSSSDKTIAKVSSNGTVKGLKAGTVTITAKTVSGAKVATCTIHVVRKVKSITLNKSEMVLYLNNSATLKAYIAPSDATVKTVKWSSSDTSVLRVSSKGVLTPVKPGNAVITVKTVDGGLKAKCKVSVEIPATSFKISKSSLTLYSGKSATLTASISPSNTTNKTVTWTSSNTKVATVQNGKITGVGGGKATITAKTSNGITRTCSVTVLKSVSSVSLNTSAVSVYTGSSYKLTATVLPSDASNKKVSWSSSNNSIATVDESGNVKAIKAGSAVITVTTADGSFKATCKVTVLQHVTSVTLDKTSLVLARGTEAKLTATVLPSDASSKSVKWESSNPDIVSVSVSGVVTAKAVGEATVTVITDDGAKKAVCRINVYESVTGVSLDISEKILYIGESVTINATVSPSDASNKSITWSSSDPSVANVASNGVVTALKVGEVTVTAKTADGGFTDTCKITVRAHVTGVALSAGEVSVSRGGTLQLTASVIPENSFEKGIVWKSENEDIATVEDGKVTALKKGEAVITVTSVDGGFTASCKVNVTEPVTGITLSSNEITVYTGQSETLTAAIEPENASDKRVVWTSSDENIA